MSKSSILQVVMNKIGDSVTRLRGPHGTKEVLVSAQMVELRTLLEILRDSEILGDDLLKVFGGLSSASLEAQGISNPMGRPSQMINEILDQIKEGL